MPVSSAATSTGGQGRPGRSFWVTCSWWHSSAWATYRSRTCGGPGCSASRGGCCWPRSGTAEPRDKPRTSTSGPTERRQAPQPSTPIVGERSAMRSPRCGSETENSSGSPSGSSSPPAKPQRSSVSALGLRGYGSTEPVALWRTIQHFEVSSNRLSPTRQLPIQVLTRSTPDPVSLWVVASATKHGSRRRIRVRCSQQESPSATSLLHAPWSMAGRSVGTDHAHDNRPSGRPPALIGGGFDAPLSCADCVGSGWRDA